MEYDVLAFGQDLIAARPRLRRTALNLAADAADAGQLVQQAMTDAWRSRGEFRPGQNLDDWLHRILTGRIDGERRSFAPED
jgi:DNA-directed RNA polymerase specialized sigma24 family protein